MKNLLQVLMISLLISCSGPTNIYRDGPDFDWMPQPLQWEINVRDCRSQPQCNAADLFDKS